MSTDAKQPEIADERQQDTPTRPQHDPLFRSAFEDLRLFRELLVWLVPFVVELLDLDRTELQKDSFVDAELKTHYSDLLYKIPVKGTDKNVIVFVLLEHKTSSDHWTMLQMLRYIVQIWSREYKAAEVQGRLADFELPPVLPIIIYHGENGYTAPVRLGKLIRAIEGLTKYQLDFESLLLDLTSFDKTQPPEDLELFAVLAVMQAMFRQDAAERVLRIYKKIKPKLDDPRSREQYRGRWTNLLRYMITSSKYFTFDNLKEVTSQMSETDVAAISPCALELMAIGREEERNLWATERNELLTDKIENLLRILSKNFGEVPPAIRDRLHAIHDFHILRQLTDVAWDCQSLEEFETALNK
jgi:predicted transposase/invertase (TIGR01784 family)